MRIRSSLAAGAVATVAAIAFAVPGIAAATAQQPASQTPLKAASGHGKLAGIIPARGNNSAKKAEIVRNDIGIHAATAAAAACTEPACNLVYNGGPVQHTPKVYVVFWGPDWNSSSNTTAKNYVTNFFTALGQQSKGDGWSGIVQQYNDSTGGHPTINTSMLAGTWVDTSIPANTATNPITEDLLGQESVKAANHFNIPLAGATQANIVIASQQGTCFDAPDPTQPTFSFAGNCGTVQTTASYCAYHTTESVTSGTTATYLPWTNLPYQPDAGIGCGKNLLRSNGTNDGFSLVGGHEAMETVTDPNTTDLTTLGWIDTNDTLSGGEVADKCVASGPLTVLTMNGGTYAIQALWSNARSTCVLYAGLTLSVTTPPTQTSPLGKALSLQIHATVGGNTPLKYFASGLPAGLSINKTTGVISGTPGITAGTYTARAAAAYYWGPSKTVTFTWKVRSAPGLIKGWASKCVADYQARTTPYSKVVLWPCSATASMEISFFANRELAVVGRCLTGTSTTVVIGVCAGAASQTWTRLSNGEYVLKSNGKCLTAPGQTTGLQLALAACKNAGNQRWSLPS